MTVADVKRIGLKVERGLKAITKVYNGNVITEKFSPSYFSKEVFFNSSKTHLIISIVSIIQIIILKWQKRKQTYQDITMWINLTCLFKDFQTCLERIFVQHFCFILMISLCLNIAFFKCLLLVYSVQYMSKKTLLLILLDHLYLYLILSPPPWILMLTGVCVLFIYSWIGYSFYLEYT